MAAPRLASLRVLGPSSFYGLAFADWAANPASDHKTDVICVHGLTRNGRDFDPLAQTLAHAGHHIICPDMPGRGRSDWLPQAAEYSLPTYMAACSALLGHCANDNNNNAVDWIGTSMGGLIGMALAAMPNSPIRKLIINDIGPFVPHASLKRIADYVADQPTFTNVNQVEAFLRSRHAPFGPVSDAYWRHLAKHSAIQSEGGTYTLTYDAKIAETFAELATADLDLWSVWDQIQCPVLVMRGEDSDILPATVAQEMIKRGPDTTLMEWPETGHTPALENANQITTLRKFLE